MLTKEKYTKQRKVLSYIVTKCDGIFRENIVKSLKSMTPLQGFISIKTNGDYIKSDVEKSNERKNK